MWNVNFYKVEILILSPFFSCLKGSEAQNLEQYWKSAGWTGSRNSANEEDSGPHQSISPHLFFIPSKKQNVEPSSETFSFHRLSSLYCLLCQEVTKVSHPSSQEGVNGVRMLETTVPTYLEKLRNAFFKKCPLRDYRYVL